MSFSRDRSDAWSRRGECVVDLEMRKLFSTAGEIGDKLARDFPGRIASAVEESLSSLETDFQNQPGRKDKIIKALQEFQAIGEEFDRGQLSGITDRIEAWATRVSQIE